MRQRQGQPEIIGAALWRDDKGIDRTGQRQERHEFVFVPIGSPEVKKRRQAEDHRAKQERGAHRFDAVPTDSRNEHTCRQRKEKRIAQSQQGAPKLARRHTAEHERQRQNRKDGEQAIGRPQGGGHDFSRHYVIAAQVGQEEEAERAIPLLVAQTVSGQKYAAGAGESEAKPLEHAEEDLADGDTERLVRKRPGGDEASHEEHGQSRRYDACPIRAALARGDAQFASDDGQEGQSFNTLALACLKNPQAGQISLATGEPEKTEKSLTEK